MTTIIVTDIAIVSRCFTTNKLLKYCNVCFTHPETLHSSRSSINRYFCHVVVSIVKFFTMTSKEFLAVLKLFCLPCMYEILTQNF